MFICLAGLIAYVNNDLLLRVISYYFWSMSVLFHLALLEEYYVNITLTKTNNKIFIYSCKSFCLQLVLFGLLQSAYQQVDPRLAERRLHGGVSGDSGQLKLCPESISGVLRYLV